MSVDEADRLGGGAGVWVTWRRRGGVGCGGGVEGGRGDAQ